MDPEARERVLGRIRGELEEDEVVLAVVHGGFLRARIFRDLDLAVFTGY